MASSSKVKTVFACQACGFESSKWLGRCPDCGEWNSLLEETTAAPARGGAAPALGGKPIAYESIDTAEQERILSGIPELDRVLGGGIVPGSLVLFGGEPGVGKSTLLLQVAHALSRRSAVLYVSGEESERQVKMRGERLGLAGGALFLMGETSLERILGGVDRLGTSLTAVG